MTAQILKPTPENFAIASEALHRGEVVAIPTETVYGLAGDALNPLALARIFETKERPTFDPLIVHVGFQAKRISELDRLGLVEASRLSPPARELADRLLENFWPGPLTLVLPKKEKVPDLATSGLPTVAIRMPRHSVAQGLIAASGLSLAAPSANRFGRISPTSAKDVLSELGDRIDWILDGGKCEIGVESTILSISPEGELDLLRPGGLPIEEIENLTGLRVQKPLKSNDAPIAPGMLESHYAPRKQLILLPEPLERLSRIPPELSEKIATQKPGLLSVLSPASQAAEKFRALTGKSALCQSLSETGDLNEAARNLFHSLRSLDESDVSLIIAEPCETQTGLGYAIGDRLKRAAAPVKHPC